MYGYVFILGIWGRKSVVYDRGEGVMKTESCMNLDIFGPGVMFFRF